MQRAAPNSQLKENSFPICSVTCHLVLMMIYWHGLTLSGRQMNIRRRSAEAKDARNTFVGLCLTWKEGEASINLIYKGRYQFKSQ